MEIKRQRDEKRTEVAGLRTQVLEAIKAKEAATEEGDAATKADVLADLEAQMQEAQKALAVA